MTSNYVVKALTHSYDYALRAFPSIYRHFACHFVIINES